eukprot:1267513-Pleurochrysis_carterae.AAC.3
MLPVPAREYPPTRAVPVPVPARASACVGAHLEGSLRVDPDRDGVRRAAEPQVDLVPARPTQRAPL